MNALLDANVLFSITLTDVLLTLAQDHVITPFWTERILDEAERSLVERQTKRGLPDLVPIRRRFLTMRNVFGAAMIDPDDYEHLMPQMRNEKGDRHVLAAAVAASADRIVTDNVRHFPPRALSGLPVGGVATPDAFLCALHGADPLVVERAIDHVLNRRRRPPMTLSDLAKRLERSGANRFAARLSVAIGNSPRTERSELDG